MPRLFDFNRKRPLNAVSPHFMPFVRSMESLNLETGLLKKRFSVTVKEGSEQALEVCLPSGTRISIPIRRWRRCIQRYLDLEGETDLVLYRDIGPLNSYLVPIVERFFVHLRSERCNCFYPLAVNNKEKEEIDHENA